MTATVETTPRLGEPDPAWRRRLADVPWPEVAAPVALVVLLIGFGIGSPGFLGADNVEGILLSSAVLLVLVLGQTFVVATSGIDLSVASTMTLGAIALGEAYSAGWPIVFCILAALGTSTAIGVVNGLLIAKGRITDFVVTLGMFSAASGLALIFADGKPTAVADSFLLKITADGVWIFAWSVVIALVLAVAAHLVLFHTPFGTNILATGGSAKAARATGVKVDRAKIAAYAISGFCAGTAAVLLVSFIGASEPASNTSFLLNSVAAVVLGGVSLFGGRATILGPVCGALLLTALVNGLTRVEISEFYQPLTVGAVVIMAAFLSRFDK